MLVHGEVRKGAGCPGRATWLPVLRVGSGRARFGHLLRTSRDSQRTPVWKLATNGPDDVRQVGLVKTKLKRQSDRGKMLADHDDRHFDAAARAACHGQTEAFTTPQFCRAGQRLIQSFDLSQKSLKIHHGVVSDTSRERTSADFNERGVSQLTRLTHTAQSHTGAFVSYHDSGFGIVEQHNPSLDDIGCVAKQVAWVASGWRISEEIRSRTRPLKRRGFSAAELRCITEHDLRYPRVLTDEQMVGARTAARFQARPVCAKLDA
jgi:hypothetical protein